MVRVNPTLLLGFALLALAPLPHPGSQGDAQAPQQAEKEQELAALQEKLAGDPAPEHKVRLLRDAGYALQDLDRHGEAAELFAQGAELARASGDDQLLVVHLGNLANSCFYLGEYPRGLTACNEAISVAQKLGRKDHLWRLANTCGAVNLRLADYQAAMTAFDLALQNVPQDEPGPLGLLYNNLATAHMHVGELKRADELLDLAEPLLKENAPPIYVSGVYATRADLRVLQGREAEGLEPQLAALRIRTEAGAEPEIAQSLVGLGRIHFGLGDFEQSKKELELALEIQTRMHLQADQVATLGCLAETYAKLGSTDEAETAALQGLALGERIEVVGQRVETLHSLAKVLEAEGDPTRALAVLREAVELERKQNTLDVRQRTANLQQSIDLVHAQSTVLSERDRRHKQLVWLSSSGAALLLGAALVGWGLYWSKRKALRELDQAHGELRAAGAAVEEHSRELESARGEIRGLEEDRMRASHLEALGVLSRGIAHDFNNTLTAVLGNVSLARQGLAGRPDLEAELESCVAAIEQASRLSRQLIEISLGAAPARELCALGPLLREGAALAATGSHTRLSFDLPDDLWRAEVNRGQFLQIVINLVLNAVQAMPQGGTVTLSARNLPAASSHDFGPAVELRVEDTGPGIPDDLCSKVFESRFSTKPNGSGLGLATVNDIVRRHRGAVRLERGERGACFAIVLPAVPDSPLPAPDLELARAAPPPPPALGGARILALDDEAPVRAVYERMLSLLGLEVVLAADGPQAVAEFERARAEGRPFDLLILDLTLPGGMDGAAVLEVIRRKDPGAVAIVSSGYYDSAVFNDPELGGFAGKLEKPFTLEMLAGAIRAALALRAGPPAADGAGHPLR